ncbi:hypothetical protein MesoLj131a_57060 [Mesorhizobium sp. 131-2-1]|nr:hypothetical protein MesoLj131a_57060 [Mesorhizobium sp. 131-2-1]
MGYRRQRCDAIWIVQYVGREIRVLDYDKAVRQPLVAHLEWLRSKGYGNAECSLPYDGSHEDAISAIRFEDHTLRLFPVVWRRLEDRSSPSTSNF